jgi:hypothetical protein
MSQPIKIGCYDYSFKKSLNYHTNRTVLIDKIFILRDFLAFGK